MGLDYNYRLLSSDGSSEAKSVVKFRNDHDLGIVALNIGAILEKRLSESFSLSAGMRINVNGEKVKKEKPFLTMDPEDILDVTFRYYYVYVDLPIRSSYFFKRHDVYFGLYPSIHVSSLVHSIKEGEGSEIKQHTSEFNLLAVSVEGGYNFLVYKGQRGQFKLGPNIKFNLNSIISEPVRQRNWEVGVEFAYSPFKSE